MCEIKKRMGVAYTKFVKEYILSLSISDEEKNELLFSVMENISNNSSNIS
jgi:hypothetical protein